MTWHDKGSRTRLGCKSLGGGGGIPFCAKTPPLSSRASQVNYFSSCLSSWSSLQCRSRSTYRLFVTQVWVVLSSCRPKRSLQYYMKKRSLHCAPQTHKWHEISFTLETSQAGLGVNYSHVQEAARHSLIMLVNCSVFRHFSVTLRGKMFCVRPAQKPLELEALFEFLWWPRESKWFTLLLQLVSQSLPANAA